MILRTLLGLHLLLDVSGVEQFAISLWWVDKCYAIYEDVIGLVQVDQTDAATLVLLRMFSSAVAFS